MSENRRHDFDEIIQRRGTDSKKYNTYPSDVIPMWVADTDFKAPQPVIDALKERAEHGLFGYSTSTLDTSFGEAAKKWMNKRFGLSIEEEWVTFTPSVVPALVVAIQAFSNVGDKIVIQSPAYHPFHSIIPNNGRVKVENELIYNGAQYKINFDELEQQLKDPRTKLFILCNPHNPVGRVFTQEELNTMVDLCEKYDVLIISDEIHSDIVYEGHRHIPIFKVSDKVKDFAMICINPSKTFNLPGLRTAATIIPNKRLREQFIIQQTNNRMSGETNFGTLAFKVAYNECDYYADQLVEYLSGNLALIRDYFAEKIPNIKLIQPEATYLAWLDCRELNMSQEELNSFFLEKAKVALNDGLSFGTSGLGFMRMNFGCPRSTVQEALERIERAVQAI